jgi:hypothetical protein
MNKNVTQQKLRKRGMCDDNQSLLVHKWNLDSVL